MSPACHIHTLLEAQGGGIQGHLGGEAALGQGSRREAGHRLPCALGAMGNFRGTLGIQINEISALESVDVCDFKGNMVTRKLVQRPHSHPVKGTQL